MRVGLEQADSTLSNALSQCELFSLKLKEAKTEIHEVVKVVNIWKKHFKACHVLPRDIEMLEEQIDRPFLKQQRNDLSHPRY